MIQSILPTPTPKQSSLGSKTTWHLQHGTVWRPRGQALPAREAMCHAPPCTALKCLFISICVVSSGFQAESVVCPLPLLTSLILQGKLSPRPRGISMHNVKHGFHEPPLAAPHTLTLQRICGPSSIGAEEQKEPSSDYWGDST